MKDRRRESVDNSTILPRKQASRKVKSAERAARCHKELADKIGGVYDSLPETFILHKTFSKITKLQKLDQIEKFVQHIQRHG